MRKKNRDGALFENYVTILDEETLLTWIES
jgi:hypothetical protein